MRDSEHERFTKGGVKRAIRWAVKDLDLSPVTAARAVDVTPPLVVAELVPIDRRLVLQAVSYPIPGWKVVAVVDPEEPIPAPLSERLTTFPLPAEARRGRQLHWVVSTLIDTAKALGADVTPPEPPEITWSSDDLGMGEHRRTQRQSWTIGDIEVVAEVADHEVYDGATPSWTVLGGRVAGLPGGASVIFSASISVEEEPVGRLYVTGEPPPATTAP